MVERRVWDAEVPSSSLGTPTQPLSNALAKTEFNVKIHKFAIAKP